jgi:glycosyltransferase involved in cell wall biosynthesis
MPLRRGRSEDQRLPEAEAGKKRTRGEGMANGMTEDSSKNTQPLTMGMFGTRGVPAAYGGFETAVEEIGARLANRGHQITVYCRRGNRAGSSRPAASRGLDTYRGMQLVHLPALHTKTLETFSHTAVSAVHHATHRATDVNFVFDAANSPFIRLLRAGRTPVAVHVDGLEWKREKWAGHGRAYYRMAESLAVRDADALIADAAGIQDYYHHEFCADTTLLTYGAPLLTDLHEDAIRAVGLTSRGYHLVVARMEPENHVHLIVEAYRRSRSSRPLVVVGTAPYAAEYIDRIHRTAASEPRIRLMGGVWDQRLLDQLYGHALTYVHGHSVGGTNPSLLRAMGAGAVTLAFDVVFNREVVGSGGRFFRTEDQLARLFEEADSMEADALRAIGSGLRQRAATHYDWEVVTDGYEQLAYDLVAGRTTRNRRSGRRRRGAGEWTGESPSADEWIPSDSGASAESLPDEPGPSPADRWRSSPRPRRSDGKVRER